MLTVTAQELSDASKELVFFTNVISKMTSLISHNYEPLSANGQTIYSPAVLKVTGSNEGIERSLQVTQTFLLLVTTNW